MKKSTKNGPASDDDAKADANASTSTPPQREGATKDQRNIASKNDIANDPNKKGYWDFSSGDESL